MEKRGKTELDFVTGIVPLGAFVYLSLLFFLFLSIFVSESLCVLYLCLLVFHLARHLLTTVSGCCLFWLSLSLVSPSVFCSLSCFSVSIPPSLSSSLSLSAFLLSLPL